MFIAANIREVALEYTNSETLKNLLQDGTNADRVIMAIMAIPICAICSIRNLGKKFYKNSFFFLVNDYFFYFSVHNF